MGALYNLNIDEDYIGDIIITKNRYYFIINSIMNDYIKNNLNIINKYNVKLIECDIPIYEREYIDLEYIVSSNRIDSVISNIINKPRSEVNELISKKEVVLNYDILTNKSYMLKEEDIFSIRKYGKYKYIGILNKTKKEKLIIHIKKYN